MTIAINAQDILNFWYTPPMPEHWFNPTTEIDQTIHDRFAAVWEQAASGELDDWKNSAEGCLALCIILDQFPLNMFRGDPRSFATEQQAVSICKHAVAQGFDKQLSTEQAGFLYMPLMHSENRADQDESVRLFDAAGLDGNARFARHHRAIVEKYGRFPHRNAILGRESSAAELEYLASDQAFTG